MRKLLKDNLKEGTQGSFGKRDALDLPKGVECYYLSDSVSCDALYKYESLLVSSTPLPRIIVIELSEFKRIDAAAAVKVIIFFRFCAQKNIKVIIVCRQDKLPFLLSKEGIHDIVGPRHIVKDLCNAVALSKELLKEEPIAQDKS
ncbi:MAG: STAS domain-containing protein [Candidatus Omnitrophota bacterium]